MDQEMMQHEMKGLMEIEKPEFHQSNAGTGPLDLSGVIQSFRQLIQHADSTAKKIKDLLKVEVKEDFEFAQCPFDTKHRMPPEALFQHFLTCTSSSAVLDLEDIISNLRYPQTLSNCTDSNSGFKTLDDSDICVTLEDEDIKAFGCKFFYHDAPGVVNLNQREEMHKMLTIPKTLAAECLGNVEDERLPDYQVELLPSEIWSLRKEVAAWDSVPQRYSFVVVQAAFGLSKLTESEILKWLLTNSPLYGVVLDVNMAKHLSILLSLCLKLFRREALVFYLREKSGDGSVKSAYLSREMFFQCQSLYEASTWLISQISILYGHVNGNNFVTDILRNAFVSAANEISCGLRDFDLQSLAKKQDLESPSVNLEEHPNEIHFGTSESSRFISNASSDNQSIKMTDLERVFLIDKQVSVSQVAIAVSALHERLKLEETIRALRSPIQQPKLQRLANHEAYAKLAAEQRKKRPDFKPIIEHDGLLWQRTSSNGSNKHKTRAEILAEERDYKRRRMSYRGKKVKRTPIQVLRDIIDGHMDEIKFAGGIGCVEMPETQLNPLDSSNSLFDRSDKHFFSEDKNQQERRNVSRRKESFEDARHGESHNNLTKHVVHNNDSGPRSNKASIITDDGRRRLNEIEQLKDYAVSHHEARYSSSNNDYTSKQTRSSDIEHKREHHHKVTYSTSNDKHKSRHRRESHSQEKHHSHISSGRRHAEHRGKEYNRESSNDRWSPVE